MKSTLKLTFVALVFAAFTTSCDNASKTAESAGDAAGNAAESVETTVDEATTPQEGDTAVVQEKEADAIIEKDAAEANAAKTEAAH